MPHKSTSYRHAIFLRKMFQNFSNETEGKIIQDIIKASNRSITDSQLRSRISKWDQYVRKLRIGKHKKGTEQGCTVSGYHAVCRRAVRRKLGLTKYWFRRDHIDKFDAKYTEESSSEDEEDEEDIAYVAEDAEDAEESDNDCSIMEVDDVNISFFFKKKHLFFNRNQSRLKEHHHRRLVSWGLASIPTKGESTP